MTDVIFELDGVVLVLYAKLHHMSLGVNLDDIIFVVCDPQTPCDMNTPPVSCYSNTGAAVAKHLGPSKSCQLAT